MRGLIGTLQWPTGQSCPQPSCSISISTRTIPAATNEHLKTYGKTLRLAKETTEVPMRLPKSVGTNYGFLARYAAARGTRLDGTSHNGYLILAVPENAFDNQNAVYAILG